MGESFYYTNVELLGNDEYSSFPVIVLKGEDEITSYSIIHRFKNNGEYEYAVIGKVFAESLVESLRDYKEFIMMLSNLFRTNNKRSRNELLSELKLTKFFKQVLFTQEGYDLITGKHLYTNGEIQKTIMPRTSIEEGTIVFDSTYEEVKESKVTGMINESGVPTEIKLFDTFDKYDENYFVNQKDFMKMETKEAASFVSDNYSKILSYINSNYPSFYRNATSIKEFETQEEKIAYMAQLLDVLQEAQFGDKYTRHF